MNIGDSTSDTHIWIDSSTPGRGGDAWVTILLLLVALMAFAVCAHEQGRERRRLCADVCGQYDATSELQGTNCLCRDKRGVFDPAMAAEQGRAP